jgi:predicted protein tyrosine phosphatase
LLTLTFDDICNEPETPEDLGNAVLFNENMAQQIMRFVDDGKLPLLVHCTAGISRSGAVGEVLNWYFNRFEADDSDYRKFEIMHPDIVPNPHVRRLLLAELQRNHEKLRKKVKVVRLKHLKKQQNQKEV